MGRFVGCIHQPGHRGLHAESHFVLGDASGDFGIIGEIGIQAVQSANGFDDALLIVSGNAFGISHVRHRIACRFEWDPLKVRRQKPVMPLS